MMTVVMHSCPFMSAELVDASQHLSAYLANTFGQTEGDVGPVFQHIACVEDSLAQLMAFYVSHLA